MEIVSLRLSMIQNKLSHFFSKNLDLLRDKDPKLAIHLALTPLNLGHFSQETEAYLNYALTLKGRHFSLYDPISLKKGTLSSLKEEPLPSITTILFFGIGLGYEVIKLEKWLSQNPKRELIFFEDQIEVLRAFFSTSYGNTLLSHPQIKLFYMGYEHFWENQNEVLLKALSQPFLIESLQSYHKYRKPAFQRFKEKLIGLSIEQNIQFSEYLHVSPLVYENILQNLFHLSNSSSLLKFKDQFKNIPAIVCGAGPSLDSQGAILSRLKKKALVFAGGRALSALNNLGVEPHFSIGIDPYPQHKSTLRCNNYFELPLIFRARMFHEAVELAHGPLIHVPSASGYSFVEWLEQNAQLDTLFLDEGLNVVNFNLSVARLFGCNPIILVGTDLAYSESQAYSKAIPDEQFLPKVNEIHEQDYSINRGFIKKDNRDQPTFTLWKWIKEAQWIENFSKMNSETQIFNTAEKGLKLKDIPYKSLEEMEECFLEKTYDFEGYLQTLIVCSKSSYNLKKIIESIHLFFLSIEKTEKLLEELSEDQKVLAKAQVLEYDLTDELAYIHLLKRLDTLFERVEIELEELTRKQKKYKFLAAKLAELKPIFQTFLNQITIEQLARK